MNFRKNNSRYLTVTRLQTTGLAETAILDVTRNSQQQMMNLMQRCPLTHKEKQDLIPRAHKSTNPQGRYLRIMASLFFLVIQNINTGFSKLSCKTSCHQLPVALRRNGLLNFFHALYDLVVLPTEVA